MEIDELEIVQLELKYCESCGGMSECVDLGEGAVGTTPPKKGGLGGAPAWKINHQGHEGTRRGSAGD